jgi:hypothetical protein
MTTNTKKPTAANKVAADKAAAGKTTGKPTAQKTPAEDRSKERRGSLAALAVNVPAITRAAIGSRGFAEAGLVTHWPEIIGAELARGCQPDMLRFPKGERSDGTLTLRCIGALALEIQHQSPYLIERINSYFGYRAITRLKLIQGSLRRRPARQAMKLPSLTPAERAATEASLADLPDSEMKDALRRLGEAIRQRAKLPQPR